MTRETLALSLKETAEALSLSRRTLARLVASGALPSLRIGRRRLVRRDALAAWLEAREKP